ncbi:hypothetical protein AURANDRAFT_68672, partial [Aureococcus anophagefferens]
MDVRTATAVAMTPALVQRLSSWAPDDELLETVDGLPAGLSRDEAAALLPLAEATVSDGVPLADGPPRILQDARGRRDAEDYPAYMLPPVSPESRPSDGARESTDAVLPGSAVARLLELATLGPADDFDAAKKPRALKAPATRADAEKRARELARDTAVRVAALETLAALCGGGGCRDTAARACVAEPASLGRAVALLGGGRGGAVARAAATFVVAVAAARVDDCGKALVDAGALGPLAWLLRAPPDAARARPRRRRRRLVLEAPDG